MVDRGEDESREEAADVEAGRAVDGELGVDDLDEALLLVDHDAAGVQVAVAERVALLAPLSVVRPLQPLHLRHEGRVQREARALLGRRLLVALGLAEEGGSVGL